MVTCDRLFSNSSTNANVNGSEESSMLSLLGIKIMENRKTITSFLYKWAANYHDMIVVQNVPLHRIPSRLQYNIET
jgi:hypothetical protein